MKNKYNFLSGDYVLEFEHPLPMATTFQWFSKNCFDKHHISYEFASQPMPKAKRNEINITFETFPSLEKLSERLPIDYTIEAVALYGAPLSKITQFINVVKSKYKIKCNYLVF